MKRVLIIGSGTIGDIIDLVKIGMILSENGYKICYLMPKIFHKYCLGQDEIVSMPCPEKSPMIEYVNEKQMFGGRTIPILKRLLLSPHMPNISDLLEAECYIRKSDLIICSQMAQAYIHIAEKYHKNWITHYPTPNLINSDWAYPVGPLAWHLMAKPKFINYSTHLFWNRLIAWSTSAWTREFRRKLNLDPAGYNFSVKAKKLVTNSLSIFPRPSSWPRFWYNSGYIESQINLFDNEKNEYGFLNKKRTIFCGLSSSPILTEYFINEILLPTIEKLDLYLLIGMGWSNSFVNHPNVKTIQYISFEKVFPLVSCIIHACGIGTSTTAIMSGTPSLGLPAFGEQKVIASRLYQQGLIPKPKMFNNVSRNEFEKNLLLALSDLEIKRNTLQFRDKIILENGLKNALHIIRLIIS